MRLSEGQFGAIQGWMYRNARPVDLARYRFHFEGGSAEDVIRALAFYQNADGGFGHALEADSWNPNSSPIQTWDATEMLYEVGWADGEHPVVQGILRYLDSGADFQGGLWMASVPTNNDFPRAPWWGYSEDVQAQWGYNPTVALAGFIVRFAGAGTALLAQGEALCRAAMQALLTSEKEDPEGLGCYIRLLGWLAAAGREALVDVAALRAHIAGLVGGLVETDIDKWTGYTARPSKYVASREDPFCQAVSDLAEREVQYLLETLSPEGTWPVYWRWSEHPDEWAVSRRWWMGNLIIQNLHYLRGFGAV